jgi:hypothetical protein
VSSSTRRKVLVETVETKTKKKSAKVVDLKPKNRAEKRAEKKTKTPEVKFAKNLGKIFDFEFGLFGDSTETARLGLRLIFAFQQKGLYVDYYGPVAGAPNYEVATKDFHEKLLGILTAAGVGTFKQLVGKPIEASVAQDFSTMKTDWRVLSEVL